MHAHAPIPHSVGPKTFKHVDTIIEIHIVAHDFQIIVYWLAYTGDFIHD